MEENHQRPLAFDHGTQPDAIRLDLLERVLLHVFPPMDGYDVVTLGEGHLMAKRTASRPDESFHVQQEPHAGGDAVARQVSRSSPFVISYFGSSCHFQLKGSHRPETVIDRRGLAQSAPSVSITSSA